LAQGSWKAGDKLPSEPALATELGVSRTSVRAALAQLESEGLITRSRGNGTYVNSVRPLVHSLHLNIGSDDLITSGGHTSGISEMAWSETVADADVAARLALPEGAPVIELYRVRTSDGAPVTIEHDYFAASLLPGGSPSLGPSLYGFLSDVCGIEVAFGIATLEPSSVGDKAEIFGVPPCEPIMVIRQVDYAASERPVSYTIERNLASAFNFQLVRQGPARSSAAPVSTSAARS
jgi:GntR family transcriptional regulator